MLFLKISLKFDLGFGLRLELFVKAFYLLFVFLLELFNFLNALLVVFIHLIHELVLHLLFFQLMLTFEVRNYCFVLYF